MADTVKQGGSGVLGIIAFTVVFFVLMALTYMSAFLIADSLANVVNSALQETVN